MALFDALVPVEYESLLRTNLYQILFGQICFMLKCLVGDPKEFCSYMDIIKKNIFIELKI